MAVKRIHVNSHRIRANAKNGTDDPVVTVRQGSRIIGYAHEVTIHGPSAVVYRPDKPLSCGAKVWIETESEVTLDSELAEGASDRHAVDASHVGSLDLAHAVLDGLDDGGVKV